jgi:transcriptional regulator with XRE-family HTH domain
LEYNIFHNGNIGVFHLRIREQLRGDKNISGARIEAIRKEKGIKQVEMIESLALQGVDITSSGLSKIEGQHRGINDYELLAIANTLDVSIDELLGR